MNKQEAEFEADQAMDAYELEMNNTLKQHGFDVETLPEYHRNLILEPCEAPENYHCDGEITPREAFANWKRRLKDSGLTASEIKRAISIHF